ASEVRCALTSMSRCSTERLCQNGSPTMTYPGLRQVERPGAPSAEQDQWHAGPGENGGEGERQRGVDGAQDALPAFRQDEKEAVDPQMSPVEAHHGGAEKGQPDEGEPG